MQIIVNQLLINYQDQGKGKTIFLLHGWTSGAQASFLELGRALASKYRVISLDLPGFGKSAQPPATWGIPEYAELIQSFANKIGITPDYIIAHSNGGTIALQLLASSMLSPKKLILLGSAGIRERDKMKKNVFKLAAKPIKLALRPLPRRLQERIKKRAYGKIGSDLYSMENMKPIFKRTVNYDIQDQAKNVAQETLLIYGTQDTSTPPNFGKTFEAIMPNARLEIVPDAGHYVHIDQPDKTIELIEEFLR